MAQQHLCLVTGPFERWPLINVKGCLLEGRDLSGLLDGLCNIHRANTGLPFSRTLPLPPPVIGRLLNATQPWTRQSLTSKLTQSILSSQILDIPPSQSAPLRRPLQDDVLKYTIL